MTELTRAQVERWITYNCWDWRNDYESLEDLAKRLLMFIESHDAALRARVEKLEQDVNDYRGHYDACNKDWLEALDKLKTVQETLKEVEKERDNLAKGFNLQHFVNVRVEQKYKDLQQQLITAQETIARLEGKQ